MEIKKVDFEKHLSDNVDFSFKDLDVNDDGVIDSKDKDLTKNTEVFNMITKLLNSNDEEDELNLIDDFDYTRAAKSGSSADCPDGNCSVSLQDDCPNGNCSVSLSDTSVSTENIGKLLETPSNNKNTTNTSSTNTSGTQNPDGTRTETTINANGATVEITYGVNGKKVSSQTTNKDGSVVTSTYKYNEDGSYTITAKYADKTRTIKYNTAGKKVSYTDKFTDGKVYNATYKYNDNGSYTLTIKNKKTGAVTTRKYNSSGKITSSVSKKLVKDWLSGKKKLQTKNKVTYSYNADGSYKVTTQEYKAGSKVEVQNYDKDGNKVTKASSGNNVVTANASNYKDSINQDGVSYVVFTRFDGKCGQCLEFKNQLSKIESSLDGVANFINLDVSGEEEGKNLDNCKICDEYMAKFKIKTTGLPMIVKFVNGKPTELVRDDLYKFDQTGAQLYDKVLKDVKESIGTKTTTTTSKATATTPSSSTGTNTSPAQKNATSPTYVTGKNCKSKIAQKGVTYLIMGDTKGCGGCMRLDKQIKKLMKNGKLQNSTILSMNVSDKDGSGKIFDDYITLFNMWEVGKNGKKSVSFPQILKLVDGVPVGFVTDIKDVSDAEIISKLS